MDTKLSSRLDKNKKSSLDVRTYLVISEMSLKLTQLYTSEVKGEAIGEGNKHLCEHHD